MKRYPGDGKLYEDNEDIVSSNDSDQIKQPMARRRTRPNIEFDNSVDVATDFLVLDAVAEAVSAALAIGLIAPVLVPVLETVWARETLDAPTVEFPA